MGMAQSKMKDALQVEDFANAHLFVYGTLRRGFQSHEILRRFRAQFLARGQVRGRLYDLGEYPGAVESVSKADRVLGEVYRLPNPAHAFAVLDRFEGFDPGNTRSSLFERKETTVALAGGDQVQAWIYWMQNSRGLARRLTSGDYAMCRG